MNTSDLLSTFKEEPTKSLARYIGSNIKEMMSEGSFQKLDLELIFKIFDESDYIKPRDAIQIYTNISKSHNVNIDDFLKHVKTDNRVMKRYFSNINNDSSDFNNSGVFDSTFRSENNIAIENRMMFIEKKVDTLINNYLAMESGIRKEINELKNEISSFDFQTKLDNINSRLSHEINKLKKHIKTSQSLNERSPNQKTSNKDTSLENYNPTRLNELYGRNKSPGSEISTHNPIIQGNSLQSSPKKYDYNYQHALLKDITLTKTRNTDITYPINDQSQLINKILEEKIKGIDIENLKSKVDRLDMKEMLDICKEGDINAFKNAYLSNPDLIEKTKPLGITLLHIASDCNNEKLCNFLISLGLNVNEKDDNGWTPLLFASTKQYTGICDCLIKNGADVDEKDIHGLTPLHFAVIYRDKTMIQYLIAKNANIDAKNNAENTPLHIACENGYKEICELLVSNGAYVNETNYKLWTPLHTAVYYGWYDVCQLLLMIGANYDVKDKKGKTPLCYAAESGHIKICELLVFSGAHANINNQ